MSITVEQLDSMVDRIFEMKEEYARLKKESSTVNLKVEQLSQEVIGHLQEMERTKYSSPRGTFSFKIQESFRVPKTAEDREKFFTFLKEKGVFEEMITVNSRTLNSWATTEIEENEHFDFQIPGLDKSDPIFKPQLTRSKL